jgi:hypothetical protein
LLTNRRTSASKIIKGMGWGLHIIDEFDRKISIFKVAKSHWTKKRGELLSSPLQITA